MNHKATHRVTGLLMVFCLCTVLTGKAAANQWVLTGKVEAGQVTTLRAPFGGPLEDYIAREGDLLQEGDELFTIETQKVYAPCDGIVGSVNAEAGDDTGYLSERYGALLYIEPSAQLLIKATTREAYDSHENRIIHIGETVYIYGRTSHKRRGAGVVTSVDGNAYTIEVTEGNLEINDSVSLHRHSDFTRDSRIGNGKITRNTNVAIHGEGSIYAWHVQQGQAVQRGDVLLELVPEGLDMNGVKNPISAPEASILAAIAVSPGEVVVRGQVLATLYPIASLQIAAPIAQNDLLSVKTGDPVRIELTGLRETAEIMGEVVSIAYVNSSDDHAEFIVSISFQATEEVRIGMEAAVYCEEK